MSFPAYSIEQIQANQRVQAYWHVRVNKDGNGYMASPIRITGWERKWKDHKQGGNVVAANPNFIYVPALRLAGDINLLNSYIAQLAAINPAIFNQYVNILSNQANYYSMGNSLQNGQPSGNFAQEVQQRKALTEQQNAADKATMAQKYLFSPDPDTLAAQLTALSKAATEKNIRAAPSAPSAQRRTGAVHRGAQPFGEKVRKAVAAGKFYDVTGAELISGDLLAKAKLKGITTKVTSLDAALPPKTRLRIVQFVGADGQPKIVNLAASYEEAGRNGIYAAGQALVAARMLRNEDLQPLMDEYDRLRKNRPASSQRKGKKVAGAVPTIVGGIPTVVQGSTLPVNSVAPVNSVMPQGSALPVTTANTGFSVAPAAVFPGQ